METEAPITHSLMTHDEAMVALSPIRVSRAVMVVWSGEMVAVGAILVGCAKGEMDVKLGFRGLVVEVLFVVESSMDGSLARR